MVGDPRPVFGLLEDPSDLPEGQLAEHPEAEYFPVWFLKLMENHMNSEGAFPVRQLFPEIGA